MDRSAPRLSNTLGSCARAPRHRSSTHGPHPSCADSSHVRTLDRTVGEKDGSPGNTPAHRLHRVQLAAALRQFPLVNASLDGNNIVYHNEIHIGIAVALDHGLIVPVIRGADEKNVLGLQRAIVDLATRARSRQLKPDEVLGGTFSIT